MQTITVCIIWHNWCFIYILLIQTKTKTIYLNSFFHIHLPYINVDITKIQSFITQLSSAALKTSAQLMLKGLHQACMSLETMDKTESDTALRKAIYELGEYKLFDFFSSQLFFKYTKDLQSMFHTFDPYCVYQIFAHWMYAAHTFRRTDTS